MLTRCLSAGVYLGRAGALGTGVLVTQGSSRFSSAGDRLLAHCSLNNFIFILMTFETHLNYFEPGFLLDAI